MKNVPLKPAGPLYSAPFYAREEWEKNHRRMYERIDNMKGVLDHTPPWHDQRLMDNLKAARKWYEAANGAEIARENKLLVDKLYSLSKNSYLNQQRIRAGLQVAAPGLKVQTSGSEPDLRTGGKVHDALRRRNAHIIEADNEALVGRILSVKKTIDMKAFQKDFSEHKAFSKLRSRLPQDLVPGPHGPMRAKPKPKPKEKGPVRSASEGTRGFFLAPGDLAPAPPREKTIKFSDSDPKAGPSPMVFVRSFPAQEEPTSPLALDDEGRDVVMGSP